ncbi:MAG TPA: hypothetical protein VFV67_26845 [Actinophytocola sp.]|uniref:hypothetical protein n=1 Tax=Actinophytocola sp. TaxID=1872138 RepID=UPI002DBC4316|nr:hypothetical protein [Actinophytocola sp.]HEU5474282.1 hypothetical protein [Actinophytocola sp.]
MGIRTRLIAAALAALLAGLAGATTASSASASPPPSKPSADKQEDKDRATLAKVAASLKVSVRQLVTALDNLKKALAKGVAKPAAVRDFAKELGISVADAEKALTVLAGEKKPGDGKGNGVPAEVVKLLATELHISADAARQVFRDLEKVDGKGAEIVTDPAFVAIADKLGITPQRLLDTLIKVKQEYGKQNEKDKVPGGAPAK